MFARFASEFAHLLIARQSSDCSFVLSKTKAASRKVSLKVNVLKMFDTAVYGLVGMQSTVPYTVAV